MMLTRLALCIIVNWIIIDRFYYRKSQRRDFYFTFMLISIAIFFLVFFMIFVLEDMKGKTGIGIGIGLFGIFSIMRYRTDTMPVREMTYLFVLISLSVVNALAESVSLAEILLTNAIVIFMVAVCENFLKIHPTKLIQYDRIELIAPERREELIADLEQRLGLHVKHVEVGGIDLLRDMAVLKVHYDTDKKDTNTVDNKVKLHQSELLATMLMMLMLLIPVGSKAQSDDFGLQSSIGIEKKITKKWDVGIEGELRTRDDSKAYDRWSAGVSTSYKVLPWLKASAGYTFLYDNNKRTSYYDETDSKVIDGDAEVGDPKKYARYWAPRHRFNVALTATKRLGNFKFSLRERWQYTYRPEKTVSERWSYINQAMDGKPHTYSGAGKNVLRSRLQIEYAKKKAPLTPYVSAELFNAWAVQKVRYTAGVDWKINKHQTFGLFYRYQDVNKSQDDSEPDRHVLGLGYNLKF